MGLMSNTVSIYQYRAVGPKPEGDPAEWVRECLAGSAFMPIDSTPDEEACGWVHFDSPLNADFDNIYTFKHEQYFTFTFRRDQRKVPATLLRNRLAEECDGWLSQRPQLKRVPVKCRMEMRENIHAALLSKTLPAPATWDVLWNTENDIVTIATTNQKVLDLIEDHFSETFPGLILKPIHPMSRAKQVLDDEKNAALSRLNKSSSQDVLEQINANKWLGWDFFLWLMYQTAQGSSEYRVTVDGPLALGSGFISYLHDRFVLVNDQDDSVRKSSIIGPQKNFNEARQALMNGKNIVDGTIIFESNEEQWKMSLKSDIFAFGSYKCPKVKLENDDITDAAQEREAAFFERMYLMETGLQMFDSLLNAFLEDRLLGRWQELSKKIEEWLHTA